MGIFDYLKNKYNKNKSNDVEAIKEEIQLSKRQNKILEENIESFFPESGYWIATCFDKPSDIAYRNLPCHLRDNAWMSKLLHEKLKRDNVAIIPANKIKSFMDSSERFNELRYEHELKIVKWQINWVMGGGDNWLLPKGYDDFGLYISENVDEIHRYGVSGTLQAIGMNREVIEEGLEKYHDLWRKQSMNRGFFNRFEKIIYSVAATESADENHKDNWIKYREYQYYQNHKDSVDKYGEKIGGMNMTKEEASNLKVTLDKQNYDRNQYLDKFERENSFYLKH